MQRTEKVRIFVDFWNFQLSWNQYHARRGHDRLECRVPWESALAKTLVTKANPTGLYVGTHVYASIDPNNPADRKLNGFFHAMDGFDGYNVTVKERRPASAVHCKNCKKEISICPECKALLKRTVEKGIDATLLTDLIRSAFDDIYDQAILITEDSDFVPAVKFIQERWNKQIVHAYFRGKSDELRNACWKHVFIDDLMSDLLPGVDLKSSRPASAPRPLAP
jgi:hypothetical protein